MVGVPMALSKKNELRLANLIGRLTCASTGISLYSDGRKSEAEEWLKSFYSLFSSSSSSLDYGKLEPEIGSLTEVLPPEIPRRLREIYERLRNLPQLDKEQIRSLGYEIQDLLDELYSISYQAMTW